MNKRIFTLTAMVALLLGAFATPAQAVYSPALKPPRPVIQCITTPCAPDGTRTIVKPISNVGPRYCYYGKMTATSNRQTSTTVRRICLNRY